MQKVYFVGLDIAKNVFQVFLADEKGRQIANKKFRHNQVAPYFANLSSCAIGMEACGLAHYWSVKVEKSSKSLTFFHKREKVIN